MTWSFKTVGSLCPVTNLQISSLDRFYMICELKKLILMSIASVSENEKQTKDVA